MQLGSDSAQTSGWNTMKTPAAAHPKIPRRTESVRYRLCPGLPFNGIYPRYITTHLTTLEGRKVELA